MAKYYSINNEGWLYSDNFLPYSQRQKKRKRKNNLLQKPKKMSPKLCLLPQYSQRLILPVKLRWLINGLRFVDHKLYHSIIYCRSLIYKNTLNKLKINWDRRLCSYIGKIDKTTNFFCKTTENKIKIWNILQNKIHVKDQLKDILY